MCWLSYRPLSGKVCYVAIETRGKLCGDLQSPSSEGIRELLLCPHLALQIPSAWDTSPLSSGKTKASAGLPRILRLRRHFFPSC